MIGSESGTEDKGVEVVRFGSKVVKRGWGRSGGMELELDEEGVDRVDGVDGVSLRYHALARAASRARTSSDWGRP